MFCSKCGAKLKEEAQFCAMCGNPVVQGKSNYVVKKSTNVEDIESNEKGKEKNKGGKGKTVVIICIFVVVIICGIAGVLFFPKFIESGQENDGENNVKEEMQNSIEENVQEDSASNPVEEEPLNLGNLQGNSFNSALTCNVSGKTIISDMNNLYAVDEKNNRSLIMEGYYSNLYAVNSDLYALNNDGICKIDINKGTEEIVADNNDAYISYILNSVDSKIYYAKYDDDGNYQTWCYDIDEGTNNNIGINNPELITEDGIYFLDDDRNTLYFKSNYDESVEEICHLNRKVAGVLAKIDNYIFACVWNANTEDMTLERINLETGTVQKCSSESKIIGCDVLAANTDGKFLYGLQQEENGGYYLYYTDLDGNLMGTLQIIETTSEIEYCYMSIADNGYIYMIYEETGSDDTNSLIVPIPNGSR